jgi:hypothetical protein
MKRRLPPALLVLPALVLTAALTGCGEGESEPLAPAPTPTTAAPAPTPTSPTSTPAPSPATTPTTPPERSAYYPLTQAEAYALVQGGIVVAGRTVPDGREVLISQTTETEYVNEPVQDEVCEYEYDFYEEDTVRKCRFETVYKNEPVQKTVYVVSLPGISRVTRDNLPGAFAYAAGLGAQNEWRQG